MAVSSACACEKMPLFSRARRSGSRERLKRTGAMGSPCLTPDGVAKKEVRRLLIMSVAEEYW